MSTRSPLPPEVSALLDRERVIPPVSAAQRARALARARASLATSGVATTARPGGAPRTRWAAAAAAALVISAALAAAAYELRARKASPPATRPAAAAPVREVVARAPAASPPPGAVEVPSPLSSPAETAHAELRLLRQARVAVARGDFAAALPPIAEHTRRFKNGRLAEEREALRVKALAGLGRTEEARRAAAAFRARFPRSVLRPAVSEMPASAP